MVSVWRWRAARELPRGRRWRWWSRTVRSTRECPGCTWTPSQSTHRQYGACTSPVPTASAAATPARSRGGSRGCCLCGTRCPQTRQGRDLRVSFSSLTLYFSPLVVFLPSKTIFILNLFLSLCELRNSRIFVIWGWDSKGGLLKSHFHTWRSHLPE